MSGSLIRRFNVSISCNTMRSSSDLDLVSPIDLMRSRNSFDWLKPPWEPIASSLPIVFSCSMVVVVRVLDLVKKIWGFSVGI
ncbi:hypothetical protein HanIR_Chr13g0653811 [Helianthus annuus]|nr:hypothetical protein HanIR_Chr13g0653811 [Helianthus annuus]